MSTFHQLLCLNVSIFYTTEKSLSINLNFQNLTPILKVSVSVSKTETGYTESQSQSQHARTGLAHPSYQKLKDKSRPNYKNIRTKTGPPLTYFHTDRTLFGPNSDFRSFLSICKYAFIKYFSRQHIQRWVISFVLSVNL